MVQILPETADFWFKNPAMHHCRIFLPWHVYCKYKDDPKDREERRE